MILFQNSSVTLTGQYYHSVKTGATPNVVLAEISVAPTTWSATNVPASHQVTYDSENKQFIFKHSTLTQIQLSEGKYSIQLNITVGSTNIVVVFVLYVVKDYRVEEHVFEGQILTGFLNEESRTLQDCTLSIFVCEKVSNAFYRRFTYTNTVNQTIEAIVLMPKKSVSIDDVDGVKHQEYSVELQPTAPIEHIFERFIDLQNQPFVDSEVNEDTLFAYLRLIDASGDSLCEGIIDTQDGRFRFQYETETVAVKRTNEAGQATTLNSRVSNSISLQIYSPSTLLKAVPVVDNVSERIDYTNGSNGKGFADYLYNEFVVLPFTMLQKSNSFSIWSIVERFAKYINRQSVLAQTGILQSTSESMEAYGYKQLCSITVSPTANPLLSERVIAIDDVIELRLLLFNFILSDTFGEGVQANGEKRSFTVERTRGLRDRNGVFPRRDSEEAYSFLLLDCAEEILNRLTLATAYLPAFEIITESAGAGTHKRYKLRTLLTRAMNTGERKGNINNIVEIDKTNRTINLVNGGEVDVQNEIIRQFDQVSAGKLSYREMNGFGQEYKGGINDGFFLSNAIEIRNQNEVRAVGATNLKIEDDLIFASRRKTRLLSVVSSFNQLSSLVASQDALSIHYAVVFKDYIRVASYYAEALLMYQSLRFALLRREIIENVQVNNLDDVKRINEATVLKTNLLSDDNVMRFYKVLEADIDIVGKSAVLKLERVKSPLSDRYAFNSSVEIVAKYDEAFIRWHGVVARRMFAGFNASAYPSSPNNLQFNSSFTSKDKKEFSYIQYNTGLGLFGDAWQGVNAIWYFFNSPKMTLVRFEDGKRVVLKNQVSVPNTFNLFAQLTTSEAVDVFKRNARYLLDVRNSDNTGSVMTFDVAKGCLVVRGKPTSTTGVGVRLQRFVDKTTAFLALPINQNYYLYAESIFTFRGKFALFSFSASLGQLIRVEFHESFLLVSPLIGSRFYLLFNQSFKAGEEIHFEIAIDNNYGNVADCQITIRLNGVNYTRSDLTTTPPSTASVDVPASDSMIACVDTATSFVCMRLFRAYANEASQWIRICDLSFNDIGANNADEPFVNPSSPFTSFCTYNVNTVTNINATENISIQPDSAFNLYQL